MRRQKTLRWIGFIIGEAGFATILVGLLINRGRFFEDEIGWPVMGIGCIVAILGLSVISLYERAMREQPVEPKEKERE